MRIPFILLVVCALPAFAQVSETGEVQGAIVDDANQPVTGARITYVRKPQLVRVDNGRSRYASPPFSSRVTSDAAGKYEASKLPAGDYDVCVEAPGYLTTCEWTQWQRTSVTGWPKATRRPGWCKW